MIDDNREEHRMLIRLNDIDPVLAKLIIGKEHDSEIKSKEGILRQRIHNKPYTITLYALLKDYGMTPISRIKPRVRFSRKSYDNVASYSPVLFLKNATVDFVEFKTSNEESEKADTNVLRKVFADGPSLKNLLEDPAQLFVSQHDAFLMNPPVKSKTKVTSFGLGKNGIPIGEFLDALNNPSKTLSIFKKFNGGIEFARDLRETLEEFKGLEFKFGIYSRYRRWDCVYAEKGKTSRGYRNTFDPYTILGWVKSSFNGTQQLQPLTTETAARWEHKIDLNNLENHVIKKISEEIKKIRIQYLIPRVMSKSKTALTLQSDWNETHLNLIDELGYDLKVEKKLEKDKVLDINERKRLRAIFNQGSRYDINPSSSEAVERYINLAIGRRRGVEYILNKNNFTQRPIQDYEKEKGFTIIRDPRIEQELILSADELKTKIPNKFDECYSREICESGYIINSRKTGRSYNVSFGKRQQGRIEPGKVLIDKPANYSSIKYIGIKPKNYLDRNVIVTHPHSKERREIEKEIIKEITDISRFMEDKKVI